MLELLRLANQLAQNCRCVPQALLHFRRELCAEDVFSATGKRAVVLSHELTMTGAPIVLVSAIPVLRSLGYEVVVLGPRTRALCRSFWRPELLWSPAATA